jgi:SNF2 family DNA or RNA helicase/uncharacterized Zn finger protein
MGLKYEFGRTWWGQQWLRSLDKIDFASRLPRGRSYAEHGRVLEIELKKNRVSAKVKGSRPKAYEVTITIPAFDKKQKAILVAGIKKNSLLISRLLNRMLPDELLQIAAETGIKIFPASWEDLQMKCTCPDSAVPCKHIAAVIYILANEIDRNPFLVFSLHNTDLVKELEKQNIHLKEEQREKILTAADFSQPAKPKKNPVVKLSSPDLSLIENLEARLPFLFTASPLFYSADFKNLILDFYKLRAKNVGTIVSALKNDLSLIPGAFRYYDYKILLEENGAFKIFASPNDEKEHEIPLRDFLILLCNTNTAHLETYSSSFRILHRLFIFCTALNEKNAVLPRLFKTGEDRFRIQWVPALVDDKVRMAQLSFNESFPENLLHVVTHNLESAVKVGERVTVVCALFNGFFSKATLEVSPDPAFSFKRERDYRIIQLFFKDSGQSFNHFSEKEIPNTIQLWLKRFFLEDKEITPLVRVHAGDEFTLEILLRENTRPMQPLVPVSEFLEKEKDRELEVLKDLQLLSHYLPEFDQLIRSRGKELISFTPAKFAEVYSRIFPVLQMLGVRVLLPKSLQHIRKPRLTLELKSKHKSPSFFKLKDLLEFDYKISVGEDFFSASEFKRLSQSASGIVKIKDQFVLIEADELEKIFRQIDAGPPPSRFALVQSALSEDYEGVPVVLSKTIRAEIKKIFETENVPLPLKLNAQLRPYQLRGYYWLYKNIKTGVGCLLADDMGLGKTLQIITTILKLKEEGLSKKTAILVIVPATLLSNWQHELEKFAPTLSYRIFHGAGRKSVEIKTDILLTTYGIVRAEEKFFEEQKWSGVIIDEAQNIRNSFSAQTRAVKKINAHVKIAMSGTPVENRLGEYWSIFDFILPGLLGNETWFNTYYAKPIEQEQDKLRLEKFRKISAPFILRRVKTDKTIISDLPDKIEIDKYCSLSPEQGALYSSVTKSLLEEISEEEGITRKGIILKLFTTLKQICNHPAQYLKTRGPVLPRESGKVTLLLQLLESIYENNEKVIIFSQYREAVHLLSGLLSQHFSKDILVLHGGTSLKKRKENVRLFQEATPYDTFLISLKAGGTGLNLTAASHVIHFDLWWNPAVEAQATDRAFRIGQTKNVIVHRLLTRGTLEEKINALLQKKKTLAELSVAQGEKWIGELTDKEIRELVSLGQDKP